MRVRDHIVLSTVGAAALRRLSSRYAVGFWAGGVLVDADHYLWYCLRERRLDPRVAVRRFNAAHAPRQAATRTLHSPAAVLALLLASSRRPGLRPMVAGVSLHVGLDRFHEARMERSRAAALRRDGFSCQACGTQGPNVETHIRKQPSLLPSYRAHNLISLCGPCHEAAHRAMEAPRPWS
jgi:hypothetical protein